MEDIVLLVRNIAYLIEKGKIAQESIAWYEIQTGRPVTVAELLHVSFLSGFSVQVLLSKDLNASEGLNIQNVKFLVLDVDGVMTDGGMIFSKNGDEIKKFSSKDGIAIANCREKGIQVGILSAGQHGGIVEKRATMLGIERFYVGKRPKLDILKTWLTDLNIGPESVAHIGDDVNDIPVMKYVAVSACPSDAVDSVKLAAGIQLRQAGGQGCVREFVDNYLFPALERQS